MSERKARKVEAKVKDHVSRRMQQLVEENHRLRHYVTEVLQRLRENESLFARLFEVESEVLAASDPESMCFSLLRGLRAGFDLDMVRFWLDRSSFMGDRQMPALSERDLVWVDQGEIQRLGLDKRRVWLLALGQDKGFDWLHGSDAGLGSLALLLLGDTANPFGVLGLGSLDGDRFAPDQATDFLQHTAQVVGLCLENAVARERLARLAITDKLTGSHNQRFLQPHSHQPLAQWFGKDMPVACLYMDVDHLQSLNDKAGRDAGDAALTAVSSTLRQLIRIWDPMIRLHGDEFAVLMPGCSRIKAEESAKRILEECNSIRVEGEALSVSIGMAYCDVAGKERVKDLIGRADRAMYVAKALGGGRLEVAEESGKGSCA